jgi:hypothetical protein
MTKKFTKINDETINNDLGLYVKASGRITSTAVVGSLPIEYIDSGGTKRPVGVCNMLKATISGDVVYQNGARGRISVINVETGETIPIVYDRILSGATIDGAPETTSASGMFWMVSPANALEKDSEA